MKHIIELLEKAEHRILDCTSSQEREEIYGKISEALVEIRTINSFFSLFGPELFNSPEELIWKAKELKIELYKDASIITYLIHVAGNIARNTHTRLFYLKAPYSKEICESLGDHNFKPAFGKENVYLGSNGFHGSLFIVELIEEE